MKTLGMIVAAAGIAMLTTMGGAVAQGGSGVTTGVGAAKTENAPSTVGLGSTERGGMTRSRMGKRKMMRPRMRKHRRRM